MSLSDVLVKVTMTLAAICIALFTAIGAMKGPWIKLKIASRKGLYAGTFFLISLFSLVFQIWISGWGIEFIQMDNKKIIPITPIISLLEASIWLFFILGVIYLIWALRMINRYL